MSPNSVPGHFEISVEHDEETATVRLAGELDIACEEIFLATLRPFEQRRRPIVVDLAALNFIDSTGLRMLIALHERSRRHGFELSIVIGTGHVRRTFQLTGLDHVLPIAHHEGPEETVAPLTTAA